MFEGDYKHFKGGQYTVIGLARCTESEDEMVVYYAAGKPEELWVRPRSMFEELVDVNGTPTPRFERMQEC